jgi:hypothetical protein
MAVGNKHQGAMETRIRETDGPCNVRSEGSGFRVQVMDRFEAVQK